MPFTYRQLVGRIRLFLLEPSPMAPKEPLVFEHLSMNAQLLFNQAINAPPSWSLTSWDLDVNDGDDQYLISPPNFGKDTLVVTVDDTDPNHIERPIRRMSVPSAPIGGREVYAYASNFTQRGIKHSAQTFVFWREPGGAQYVKVYPKPTEAATYRIWYETTEPNTDSLDNSFLFPQAASLLCVKTAFDCLPGTEWAGYTKAENKDQRQQLGVTLGAAATNHEREYRRWISSDRKSGRILANGFQDRQYGTGSW